MIALQGICKSFAGHQVLRSVGVDIAQGQVTALIGPSGSGKSTLLRCVNLLEMPDAGSLTIGSETVRFSPGVRLGRAAVQGIRQQTGMVFQNFQLFPHQTAIANVMEGLVTVLKWPADKARARALELLEKVGMAHKADAWPATLSGGQQQRVAIARALAMDPPVMLFDEPTSALDPISTSRIEDLCVTLREKYTIIIVTHNMQQAARISDNTAFFLLGEIIEYGNTEKLFSIPRDKRTEDYITGRFG